PPRGASLAAGLRAVWPLVLHRLLTPYVRGPAPAVTPPTIFFLQLSHSAPVMAVPRPLRSLPRADHRLFDLPHPVGGPQLDLEGVDLLGEQLRDLVVQGDQLVEVVDVDRLLAPVLSQLDVVLELLVQHLLQLLQSGDLLLVPQQGRLPLTLARSLQFGDHER